MSEQQRVEFEDRDHVMSYLEGDDNTTEAVRGLDIFTKNWCMNCKETKERGEPIFRCQECAVKQFANIVDHNYPMDKFGSMSR